jgi:hypothetical protein
MACPGLIRGQVRVELYEPQNVTKFIQAHDSPLRCVVLSLDGSLVATASEKGTLVRVFDCQSGCLLHEFRRGTDRATIYSLAFSKEKEWLVCTSDKGTVHLYRIPEGSIMGGGGGGGTGEMTHSNSSDNIASRDHHHHYHANSGNNTPTHNNNGHRAPPQSPMTPKSPSSMLQSVISMGVAANVLPKYLQAERSFAQFRMNTGGGGVTPSGNYHGGHAPAFHRVKFQLVVIPVRANNDYSIVFRRRKRGFTKSKRMLRELARSMMIALSVVVSSRSDPSSAGVHAKLRERASSRSIRLDFVKPRFRRRKTIE